ERGVSPRDETRERGVSPRDEAREHGVSPRDETRERGVSPRDAHLGMRPRPANAECHLGRGTRCLDQLRKPLSARVERSLLEPCSALAFALEAALNPPVASSSNASRSRTREPARQPTPSTFTASRTHAIAWPTGRRRTGSEVGQKKSFC